MGAKKLSKDFVRLAPLRQVILRNEATRRPASGTNDVQHRGRISTCAKLVLVT